MMAASATFALKAGVWFRRGSGVSIVHQYATRTDPPVAPAGILETVSAVDVGAAGATLFEVDTAAGDVALH